MNKMKKRIVALSTAFVMAFALVAALVPATANAADLPISFALVEVTPPTVGQPLATNDDANGNVTAGEGGNCYVSNWGFYADDGSKLYGNPAQAGVIYMVKFVLKARNGYAFNQDPTIQVTTTDGTSIRSTVTDVDPDGKFVEVEAFVRATGGEEPAPAPAVEEATTPAPQETAAPAKAKASAAKAKTADPVPYAAVAVLVAGVAAVSVVVIRRRRNF